MIIRLKSLCFFEVNEVRTTRACWVGEILYLGLNGDDQSVPNILDSASIEDVKEYRPHILRMLFQVGILCQPGDIEEYRPKHEISYCTDKHTDQNQNK